MIKIPTSGTNQVEDEEEARGKSEEEEGGGIKEVEYDWTFGSDYDGEMVNSENSSPLSFLPSPSSNLDMTLLQDTSQPILFYAELDLLGDDLHDCGLFSLGVRVRVMPTCFFVLMREVVRVDGVSTSIRESRLFHAFPQDPAFVY